MQVLTTQHKDILLNTSFEIVEMIFSINFLYLIFKFSKNKHFFSESTETTEPVKKKTTPKPKNKKKKAAKSAPKNRNKPGENF